MKSHTGLVCVLAFPHLHSLVPHVVFEGSNSFASCAAQADGSCLVHAGLLWARPVQANDKGHFILSSDAVVSP